MIYTDGIGTIANVREDSGKVLPHSAYAAVLDENTVFVIDDLDVADPGIRITPGNDWISIVPWS